MANVRKPFTQYVDKVVEVDIDSLTDEQVKEFYAKDERLKAWFKGADDQLFFNNFFLEEYFYQKPAEFHKQLIKNFEEVLKQPSHRKFGVFAAPRGFAKSTSVFSFVLRQILYKRFKYVVICSQKEDKAISEHMVKIKKVLELNERVKWCFGDMKSDTMTWRDDLLELTNGCRIKAIGVGQDPRGQVTTTRPDLIWCDDLESREYVQSELNRRKIKSWFFSDVIPGGKLDGGTVFLVVGTIVHPDSLLNNLLNDKSERYKTKIWKAFNYDDDGKPFSLWPEMVSVKQLEEIKKFNIENGSQDTWFMEYQNEPRDPEKSVFKEAWLKYYEMDGTRIKTESREYELKELDIYVGFDFAYSLSKKADYTAIVVIGVTKDNYIYVLDVYNKRVQTTESLDIIFDIYQQWNPLLITIQKDSMFSGLKPILEHTQRMRNVFLPIHEVQVSGYHTQEFKKHKRIEVGLAKRFQWGNIFIKKEMTELIDQFLNFPAAHDDILDALNDVVNVACPPTENFNKEELQENRRRGAFIPLKNKQKNVMNDDTLGSVNTGVISL